MMHTEEEAKTKWCSHIRHSGGEEQPSNAVKVRENRVGEWNSCIGCKCMAWRWRRDDQDRVTKDYGYCGLAGKP